MEKKYVLFNAINCQYWTGRFWDNPYTTNIKDAKQFSSEDELVNEISTSEDENLPIYELINEAYMFEVRTIYAHIF